MKRRILNAALVTLALIAGTGCEETPSTDWVPGSGSSTEMGDGSSSGRMPERTRPIPERTREERRENMGR